MTDKIIITACHIQLASYREGIPLTVVLDKEVELSSICMIVLDFQESVAYGSTEQENQSQCLASRCLA